MKKPFFLFAALLLVPALLTQLFWSTADADDHERKKKRKSKTAYAQQMPPAYKDSCGGCHMAYIACLLPGASWQQILDTTDAHFNTSVDLDADARAEISAYLQKNAADQSGGKLGRKVMRDLRTPAPERISTLPYITHKHRKLDPAIFQRPSVDGIANCVACHPGAEQGDFDDDRVRIPD